jgi:hypothetical protein
MSSDICASAAVEASIPPASAASMESRLPNICLLRFSSAHWPLLLVPGRARLNWFLLQLFLGCRQRWWHLAVYF